MKRKMGWRDKKERLRWKGRERGGRVRGAEVKERKKVEQRGRRRLRSRGGGEGWR